MGLGHVSLQGELGTFGVEDVLRLVAAKQGVLVFEHPGRAEVRLYLETGRIVGAESGASIDPVQVVCDLLRRPHGSFAFVDGLTVDQAGPGVGITEVVPLAMELVAKWDDVEAVIPTPEAQLTLNTDCPDRTRG